MEPLATRKEVAEQKAIMAEKAKFQRQYKAWFTQEVDATAWYDQIFFL